MYQQNFTTLTKKKHFLFIFALEDFLAKREIRTTLFENLLKKLSFFDYFYFSCNFFVVATHFFQNGITFLFLLDVMRTLKIEIERIE